MLVCPRCRSALEVAAVSNEIVHLGDTCGRDYAVDAHGVVGLEPNGAWPGTGAERNLDLQDLNRRLGSLLDTGANLEDELVGDVYDTFVNPNLADWTLLGDFDGSTVLHIGRTFGAVPLQLARAADQVVTIDSNYERVQATAHLARLMELTNITAVHGEVVEPAVVDAGVDRIVLGDAVAEVATLFANSHDDPATLQVRLLEQLRARLKPDGELWLAVDNRFGAQHYVGRGRAGAMPFAPLIPRFLTSRLAAWTNRDRPPRHLTSERELRSTLGQAGFSNLEWHYAFMSYERPHFITSTVDDGVISNYLQTVRVGGGKTARLAIQTLRAADKTGMLASLAPSFVIRARP